MAFAPTLAGLIAETSSPVAISSDSEEEDLKPKGPIKLNLKNNVETDDGLDDPTRNYYNYLNKYKEDVDVAERVKGVSYRGAFKTSENGYCPKCACHNNVFVILDFLFPMGDMPELLQYLITQGKAVLWSSQDISGCKVPPTFLCRGKCPSDVNKCGFNLDWEKADLDSIYLFPKKDVKTNSPESESSFVVLDDTEDNGKSETNEENIIVSDTDSVGESARSNSNSDSETEEEEYDEADVDIAYYKEKVAWVVIDEAVEENELMAVQEEGIIRNMLALEEARTDFEQGEMRRKSNSSSPETVAISDSEKSTTPKANSPDLSEALEIVEKPKVATVSPLIATIAANQKKPSKAFAPTLAFLSDTKSTVLEIIENQASNPRKAPVNYPTKQENEAQQRYAKSVPNVKPYVYVPPAKLVQTPKATVVPGKDRPLPVGSAYTAKEATGKTPSHILKGATYYTGDQKNPEVNKPAFTAADFPISLDGICPYCKSADVVYVILQDDDMDDDLPDLLARLEKAGKALKMKKGEYDLPSFQCRGCTYGFNLDWAKTNLEEIFKDILRPSSSTSAPSNPYSVPPPNPYSVPPPTYSSSNYSYNQQYPYYGHQMTGMYGNNPFAMGQSNPWFNQSNPYMAGSMSTPFMPPFGQNVGFFNQQFGTMPGYNPQYGAVGGFNPGFAGSNPYSFTALTPRQSLLGNVPLPGPGVSNHTRFNQVKDLYKAAKEDNEEGKDKDVEMDLCAPGTEDDVDDDQKADSILVVGDESLSSLAKGDKASSPIEIEDGDSELKLSSPIEIKDGDSDLYNPEDANIVPTDESSIEPNEKSNSSLLCGTSELSEEKIGNDNLQGKLGSDDIDVSVETEIKDEPAKVDIPAEDIVTSPPEATRPTRSTGKGTNSETNSPSMDPLPLRGRGSVAKSETESPSKARDSAPDTSMETSPLPSTPKRGRGGRGRGRGRGGRGRKRSLPETDQGIDTEEREEKVANIDDVSARITSSNEGLTDTASTDVPCKEEQTDLLTSSNQDCTEEKINGDEKLNGAASPMRDEGDLDVVADEKPPRGKAKTPRGRGRGRGRGKKKTR